MQRMYDQSHQALSMTGNCPIPLGQNKIYNIKGRLQGTKGWRRRTPLEEENISACSGPASGLSLPLSWRDALGELCVSNCTGVPSGMFHLQTPIDRFTAMRVLLCACCHDTRQHPGASAFVTGSWEPAFLSCCFNKPSISICEPGSGTILIEQEQTYGTG